MTQEELEGEYDSISARVVRIKQELQSIKGLLYEYDYTASLDTYSIDSCLDHFLEKIRGETEDKKQEHLGSEQ